MTVTARHHMDEAMADVGAWNDAFARENDIDAYYDSSGWAIRWIEQMRLRTIRDMIRATPDDHIFELGCGGGHVLRMFPGARLTGVDVSKVCAAKARRNLAGLDAEVLVGEAERMDLPGGAFTKGICTEVLEHAVDPGRLLATLRRVVRPRGTIVITLPHDALIARVKSMIRYSPLRLLPPFGRISWGGDRYHLHTWRLYEMRTMLRAHFSIRREQHVPSRLLPLRCCFECVNV